MSGPILTSIDSIERFDPWSLSDNLSIFYSFIRELTTTSPLSLSHILEELCRRSASDGILLFSRVAGVPWRRSASTVVDQNREEWKQVEKSEAFQKLLSWLVEQASSSNALDVKAEFIPSWSSDLNTTQKGDLDALREIQDLEQKMDLNKIQKELVGLGPVCGFPLGHVMIGHWQLGETILIMVRLMKPEDAGKIRFFEDVKECLITFLVYLAEVNNHLFRKRNLERLPPTERERFLGDKNCAAAYVRSICRLAPLWIEHPEVILKEHPGNTVGCVAMIDKKHPGKEVFTPGFTPEDAIRALEEVRKALGNR